MKVLVACEFSGVVRYEFAKRGHWAWSCDLLPNAMGHDAWHYQGDVLEILEDDWDLMIAHPPCTHLASSGARWFKDKEKEQIESLAFVDKLLKAPIPKIALENPVGILSTRYKKPDQIIQPYEFGHDASKRTCLWLKSLPQLQPTSWVQGRIVNGRRCWANQTDSGQNRLPPSEDRWALRSITYEGIAKAMAEQWS